MSWATCVKQTNLQRIVEFIDWQQADGKPCLSVDIERTLGINKNCLRASLSLLTRRGTIAPEYVMGVDRQGKRRMQANWKMSPWRI